MYRGTTRDTVFSWLCFIKLQQTDKKKESKQDLMVVLQYPRYMNEHDTKAVEAE